MKMTTEVNLVRPTITENTIYKETKHGQETKKIISME